MNGQVNHRASRRRQLTAGIALIAAVTLAAGCSTPPKKVTAPRPSRNSSTGPSTSATATAPAPPAGADSFRSVPVGGGGFVTGMSISDDGSSRVVRTDGFGGYRWDADQDQWVLDTSSETMPAKDFSEGVGGGVLAVAVAPSDGSRVYMAFNDSVYRSEDGAKSWTNVLTDVPTAANDDFRGTGPRLVVDPADPDVVYYGSQLNGLYLSRDGGTTWAQGSGATGVPAGKLVGLSGTVDRPTDKDGKDAASAGVNVIAVDRSGGTIEGRSKVVYAASYGNGVYRSDDGGDTWAQIGDAQYAVVRHMVVLADGDVLLISRPELTDQKGPADVWRYHAGQWSKSGPDKEGKWSALAADPTHPGLVALMAQGGHLQLSLDDGASWTKASRTQSSDGDVPWLAWALNGGTNFMTVGDLEFDPMQPGRLWFTEGTGVWYTDLGAATKAPATVNWSSQTRGIEQLVSTGVIAPPGGKPVMSAWDRPIFRSDSLTSYPTHYGPVNQFGAAWSLDWSVSDPHYLVADVASQQEPSDPSTSGYSTDGGQTWQAFPSIPLGSTNAVTTFGFGSMAVSDPGNVVWVPAYGRRPMYTKDGGKTWNEITLPGVTSYGMVDNQAYYVNRQVIAADKATPGTFYLYVNQTGLFRTTDGGDTWAQMSDNSAMRNVDYGYNATLKAMPGREGELFLTPGRLGGPSDVPFLHSTDGGKTWTGVPDVTSVKTFGFGAPMGGSDQPTVFIAGTVAGTDGIYRSDDDGKTWTQLTTYPAGRPPAVVAMDGDKDVPGRVYLALTGSGWVYGK